MLANHKASEDEKSNGISSLLYLNRTALVSSSEYSAFLLDTGQSIMLYHPMGKKSSGEADLRTDVAESDDWIVNDVLRRLSVNPNSAFVEALEACAGGANAHAFNRHLIDDDTCYSLSYAEYAAIVRTTVLKRIHEVM